MKKIIGGNRKKKYSSKPLISIISVVLNQEKKILRNIKSVKNQTYKHFEHIIIDGGSSDKTLKIIKKYEKSIYYWESCKDKGIFNAMNKGLKKANGDIIGILNGDDFFYKNTFKYVEKYFSNNKIDFLFGAIKKKRVVTGFHPKSIKWKFNIYPSHSCSFFIKKKVQHKIGFYNQKYKLSADRDLIYRLIKNKYKGMSTKKNEVFGNFFMGGLSSKLSFIESLKEDCKIRLDNNENIFSVLVIFLFHIINKLKNIIFPKKK